MKPRWRRNQQCIRSRPRARIRQLRRIIGDCPSQPLVVDAQNALTESPEGWSRKLNPQATDRKRSKLLTEAIFKRPDLLAAFCDHLQQRAPKRDWPALH
jgi:hypothetical protein